ncbi:MAG: hypothetical protein RR994_02455 [Clostridia bacterium]
MAGNSDYKNKWLTENKERINLIVEKGKKLLIKEHADLHNESVNSFINRAIEETIKHDNENT